MNCPVRLGQKVYFDPFIDETESYRGTIVEGTVVYISQKGHWFSVAFGSQRTSFLFHDIRKKVHDDRRKLK